MATESWTNHMDVIVPGIVYLLKMLGWIIGAGFGALCAVVAYVGKLWAGKIELQAEHIANMDSKLDSITGAMALCDNCSNAASEYKRRKSDISGSK